MVSDSAHFETVQGHTYVFCARYIKEVDAQCTLGYKVSDIRRAPSPRAWIYRRSDGELLLAYLSDGSPVTRPYRGELPRQFPSSSVSGGIMPMVD